MAADMDDLKEQVRDSVREYYEQGYLEEDPQGTISEIADTAVPVYNDQLLELPQKGGHMYLATESPPHASNLGEEGSAINAIAANVYNELRQEAQGEYNKIKNQNRGDNNTMSHLGDYIVQPATKERSRENSDHDDRHRAWEVKRENAEQASRVFDSTDKRTHNRDKAMDKGKDLAKKNNCSIKFRNSRNGQFREVRNYRN